MNPPSSKLNPVVSAHDQRRVWIAPTVEVARVSQAESGFTPIGSDGNTSAPFIYS